MQILKGLLVQLLLFFSSYIIPKKKNLIILGSGKKNDFRGNPKYFYLYLNLYQTDIDAVWSTNSNEIFNLLSKQGLPVIYRNSVKSFFNLIRAKYLVIEKSAADVYYTESIWGNFNFIQTWHGIVFKKTGIEALEDNKGLPGSSVLSKRKLRIVMQRLGLLSMMKYKLILSTSKQYEGLLKKSFLNKNVKTLGYPRNDVFFNKKLIFTDFNTKFELFNFNKIILYAPTFRDNKENATPFTDEFLYKLDNFLTKNNYFLLIKKHPLDNSISIKNSFTSIKDVSSEVNDVQDLLVDIDILISDYSSIIHDFILTKRPVIYYIYDFIEYKSSCRGFYYDYHKTLSGPFVTNEQELLDTLTTLNTWSKSDIYLTKYNEQVNRFHTYQDGSSCLNLFNYLFN